MRPGVAAEGHSFPPKEPNEGGAARGAEEQSQGPLNARLMFGAIPKGVVATAVLLRYAKDHEFTAIWTLDESTPGVPPLTLDGPTSMGCQMVSAAVAERVANGMVDGGRAGAEVLFEVKRWPGWDRPEQPGGAFGGAQYPRWVPPGGGSVGGNMDTDSWASEVPVKAGGGADGGGDGDKWDNVFGGGRGGRGDSNSEGTAAEEAEEGPPTVEAEGNGYKPLRILPPPKERVPVLAPKPAEPRATEVAEQKKATPKPTAPAAAEEEVVNSWEALLSDDEEEEDEGNAEAEAGAAAASADGGGGGDGRNDVFEARTLQLVEMGYDMGRARWAVAETTQSEAWLEASMELLLDGN
mmetsp:Transcript_12085/g.32691  ORF Transcript_12085/g.32691 Transcript_12085/m.32691 type:complete len:352 (+) Transcript_12085:1187-2242(+)